MIKGTQQKAIAPIILLALIAAKISINPRLSTPLFELILYNIPLFSLTLSVSFFSKFTPQII